MGILSSELSTKQLVPLCRQLATAYGAGIPIIRSLELVSQNTPNPAVREVLADIRQRIVDGDTLGESAKAQGKRLPRMLIELLATGETGGKLDVILRDLAGYYEDRLAMKRKIMRKASYPILQLLAAWFIGSFSLTLIGRLSFMKGMNFGEFLSDYLAFQGQALAGFGVLVAICIILSRMGVFQWIWGGISTYLWPLAPVTRRFAQARFFRSLALLLGSGISVVPAIERAAAACGNPYIQRDFLQAVPVIAHGGTMLEAFGMTRFLSPVAREMLHVGEESGELENMLRKVAQYQMDEATHAVDIATRVGEVVISLAVAVLVGYIVITFWTTYYGRMFDELSI